MQPNPNKTYQMSQTYRNHSKNERSYLSNNFLSEQLTSPTSSNDDGTNLEHLSNSYAYDKETIEKILNGKRFKLNDERFKESKELTQYRANKMK